MGGESNYKLLFPFSLYYIDKELVQRADDTLLVTERRDLMMPSDGDWKLPNIKPLTKPIIPYGPDEAARLFLDCFYQRGFINICKP